MSGPCLKNVQWGITTQADLCLGHGYVRKSQLGQEGLWTVASLFPITNAAYPGLNYCFLGLCTMEEMESDLNPFLFS